MKAKTVTYKCADESTDVDRIFEGQNILLANNIRIGDAGMLIGSCARDLQILESEVELSVKILNENGFKIVKIEDDFDME